MDSSKNIGWIIPFKKFGMIRVNNINEKRNDIHYDSFEGGGRNNITKLSLQSYLWVLCDRFLVIIIMNGNR